MVKYKSAKSYPPVFPGCHGHNRRGYPTAAIVTAQQQPQPQQQNNQNCSWVETK